MSISRDLKKKNMLVILPSSGRKCYWQRDDRFFLGASCRVAFDQQTWNDLPDDLPRKENDLNIAR